MSDGYELPAQLYLVHEIAGAAVAFAAENGAGRAVAVTLGARLNRSGDELRATYLLTLDDVVALIAGLMESGEIAYGRDVLRRAMAEHLGVPRDRASKTMRAVDDAIDGVLE